MEQKHEKNIFLLQEFRTVVKFIYDYGKQIVKYKFSKHLSHFSSTFQGILTFFQAKY